MPHSTGEVDALLWAYTRRDDGLDAAEALREVLLHTRESLAVWTVIGASADVLANSLIEERRGAGRRLGGALAVRVPDRRGEFLVLLLPAAAEGVLQVASFVPATDPRWNIIRSVGRRVRHPRVASVYLNKDDFLRIGDRLAEHGGVTVSRMTARKPDGSSINWGWQKWLLPPSLADALDEANEASVRTLSLNVEGALRLHLRRDGGATFYSGRFDLFHDIVLRALGLAGAERLTLLRGRERAVGKPLQSPIAVRFEPGRLGDPSLAAELSAAIQREQPFGVAVFHGNPYLHLAVTDYVDGSNFNVFVAEDDEVRIVPGFRASIASLARLTDAIGERLGGETIQEARPIPAATLDDLFVRG